MAATLRVLKSRWLVRMALIFSISGLTFIGCLVMFPENGHLIAHPRPNFSYWGPGKWRWTWRSQKVVDIDRRYLWIDTKRNMTLLVIGPEEARGMSHTFDSDPASLAFGDMKWSFSLQDNSLIVLLPSKEAAVISVAVNFAKSLSNSLSKPEGYVEARFTDLLLSLCDLPQREELSNLLESNEAVEQEE